MWRSTLDLMAEQSGADLALLARIRSWITDGVTLDLVSAPECIHHENTFSVIQEEAAVRLRIQEYIAFGAISLLPVDHPLPFGVQPLHVIIKEDKKPRLVIDLSRNLNDDLAYEYFSYTSVQDAVNMASPHCWFSKLDLSNCFLSFPLHPSVWPHFIFRFDGQLHQFTSVPFGLASAPRICTELLSVGWPSASRPRPPRGICASWMTSYSSTRTSLQPLPLYQQRSASLTTSAS